MSTECRDREHCDAMREMLEGLDENRRGFSGVTTINIAKGETRYIGVRYCKTSRRQDRGVMLNFCPFCGKALNWWEAA